MYEEKKAFPFKWVAIAIVVVVALIGFFSYRSYLEQKKEAAYRDLLARIKKAGIAYGEDRPNQMKELEEECVSLNTLMTEKSTSSKKVYLESDSKKEPVIYNPKTGKKMTGKVYVILNEDGIILAQYMFDEICAVNYEEKIQLVISDQTTHGFVATIKGPEGLKFNSFQYKIDDGEFFKHDSPTYKFDGLISGNHKVIVKATDYLDATYERNKDVILENVLKPELVYDEVNASVTVKCPESDDKSYMCAFTVDSENWEPVTPEKNSYTFKENGQLIAMATDGTNKSDQVIQEVTIKPPCIDSKWSVCTGCTATYGSSCTGSQTSNCGNTRACTIVGGTLAECIANGTCTPTITYDVTVKASNGTPSTQTAEVQSTYNRVFTVKPNSGYQYSSVKCSDGTASYSTRLSQLTVNKVGSSRTCTVYFTKKEEIPVYYTVTFIGFDGKNLETKQVLSGKTVSPITAPAVSGYTFVSWTKNGVTYDFSTKITSNITLNAKYEANKIAVTFDTGGGSYVPTQYIITGKTAYRPYDPTKQGYKFDNWYLNNSAYNFSTPVNKPITLVAKWFVLTNKTVTMDSTNPNKSVELINFRGIHLVTDSCVNELNHNMSGNVINLSLSSAEACKVYVLYY